MKDKDEKEKEKASVRICKSVIRMIKMAASEDRERPAAVLAESCKAFLNCRSTGMGELELLEHLETLGHRNVAFAHGIIMALYGGVFLYSTVGSQTNVSVFCFNKGKALQRNTSDRALVLRLI